ncbi:hypothetical protein EDD16DRAFT_1009103 [Pisolithus croceorrhizus]|nr:hypothetical protein EDD16DRAFT_1009103 [Pisolithus croceorrhizus]
MQGHPSDYITSHDTTPPPSYTIPLLPYAVEQSLGYPQESGNVSTFGDLDSSFAGPTMGLGPIPSLRNCTPGQVISSGAPWSRLSNPLLPSFQELYPSDDFTIGDVPLPLEQTQTEIEQIRPRTPFPYTYPIPSQSNSTSYSTSDGYISFYPSFPMPNQSSSFLSPQEHLGYPLPVHPHYTRPVNLAGFHRFDSGSKMELHTSGIPDDHAALVLNDHQSYTLSDNKTHPFCNYATCIPGDHTTGDGVDDYRDFDESAFDSNKVVGLRPRLSLPPNQVPLSPRGLHSHDRVSRIEGGSLSRTFHPTRRAATARSRFPTRLSKARSVCCHNVFRSCGWRNDEGGECGVPISCGNRGDHFAAAHSIENMAWHVKIICRWCPSEPQTVVTRKNFSRHIKEVHLGCARSENGI